MYLYQFEIDHILLGKIFISAAIASLVVYFKIYVFDTEDDNDKFIY